MLKTDLRLRTAISCVLLLTACGKQRTAEVTYAKASEECAGDVIPRQFIVRYVDGSIETVRAPSEREFIEGFLTRNLDRVDLAEPDYLVRTRNQIQAVNAAPAADNWGVQRTEVDTLWLQDIRGEGVTVAVVDSGMDLTHPQLKNQVALNPGEQGLDAQGNDKATNGIDDDQNGYVDDIGGYDFVKRRPLKGDYNIHGSHVSGVIAARHDDTSAGRGSCPRLAPKAKILPLAFLDSSGSGALSDAVTAIKYALSRGARVINASWGGTQCSRSMRDVLAGLEEKNVFFVSAAGNDSTNVERYKEYPASFDLGAQFTVGATGTHDYMAEYSNYGVHAVHLFAPGTDIVSTIPGGFAALSGTSMATPFVSAAIALLLSAEPQATPAQVRQALYNTAFRRPDYLNESQGRLNLRGTLTELRRILGR
ncbi:MAG: S8 family serine peptidase [Calothrix sp. SM1_5_4]|nr:S8 family serine peptidase [Calothrix sp. SM1_5_4]